MTQWPMTLRALLRKPTFTLAAIALLAGGIAANTTVFSFVSTIFLKPLPYPAADRLVFIFEANTSKHEATSLMAPARIEDWNRLNRTFTAISGWYTDTKTDRTGTTPERLRTYSVAPRYFAVYGTKPLLGRTFKPDEEIQGGPNTVVINYAFWSRRFNRSPHVIGTRLRLGSDAYTVIGVMPPTFLYPTIDIWLPAKLNPYLLRARDARFFTGVGRLRVGQTVEQARADLASVQRQLGLDFPATDKGWSSVVSGMKDSIIGNRGLYVWIAFAAVAVLMILACVNLAGLMLGRMQQRRNELAIRVSLGATRSQLVAAVLREVTLIVIAGSALGMVISLGMISAAAKLFTTLPRITELETDWRSLVFAALLGAVTILLVGLAPALQMTRGSLASGLTQGNRSQMGSRSSLHQALLVVQFAITVVLLVSAGLLLRSYQRLTEVDAGFSPEHVLTFHVGAEWSEDRVAVGRLQRDLIETLGSTPGVAAVGMTNFLPTDEATLRYQYQVEGLAADNVEHAFTAGSRTVSGGYLAALRVPILAGASCANTPQETNSNEPPTALVNRSFAEAFGQGHSLVGRHLKILGTGSAAHSIIGVIGDVREDSLRTPAVPYVYTCSRAGAWPDPEYVVRTKGNANAFSTTLRGIVHRLAPDRALFGLETMDNHVDSALEQPRLTGWLLAGFAAAAVLLAACGLYSLCTLIVATRTREIGMRMALGARTSNVITGVLSRSAKLVATGALLGAGLALMAANLIRSLLFGVTAFDPFTFAAVCGILIVVCLGAMLFPALRAASVDPVQAIREQ